MEEKSPNIQKENLYHFKCRTCARWWSIGDPEAVLKEQEEVSAREWFCPWCGKKQNEQ